MRFEDCWSFYKNYQGFQNKVQKIILRILRQTKYYESCLYELSKRSSYKEDLILKDSSKVKVWLKDSGLAKMKNQ